MNRSALQLADTRYCLAAIFSLLGFVLSACGGGSLAGDPSMTGAVGDGVRGTMSVRLTTDPVATGSKIKKATGDNLIDLDASWPTWSGSDSGIIYDADSDRLVIPGDGSDVVLGVRRFDMALTAGVNYTLAVNSTQSQSAAVLFLFDASGSIVPVPGFNGLATARDGADVTFSAPANIAGFYLQVQNQYQATSESTIRAELIEDAAGGGTSRGDNFINANGTWLDWSGNTTEIIGTSGTVSIPAPASAESIVHGVMRYSAPLPAGAEFELAALAGSTSGSAVLLFLIDASGQIVPFVGDEQSTPWLSAMPRDSQRFLMPAGVVSYIVQVQSPYGDVDRSLIVPSLTTNSDSTGYCDAPIVAVTTEWVVPPPPVPIITDPPVQISTDGRYETFRETSRKPTDPDVVFWYTYLRDNSTGVITLLDATETIGNRTGIVDPQVSANGKYVFYIRKEDRGDIEGGFYLYRYDIQRMTRSSSSRSLGQLLQVSADGETATVEPEIGVGVVRFTETCE